MIQRKQSLFLLIAIIAGVLMIFFPFAEIDAQDKGEIIINTLRVDTENFSEQLNNVPGTWHILSLVILFVILSFVMLFQYKKRKLQMKIGRIAMIVVLGILASVIFLTSGVQESISAEHAKVTFTISTYLCLPALIMIFLANRYIKKDEDLIRSMDRIR